MKECKLENGQVFKNYKELCAFMGWETKDGNSRKKQLKQLSSLCNYTKDGYRFIIDEVFETPREIEDGRGKNSIFADDIENLLINLISTHTIPNKGRIYKLTINKNVLYEQLSMVNSLYGDIRKDEELKQRLRFCNTHVIAEETINDFLKTHYDKMRDNVERTLNNMEKRKLIHWSYSFTLGRKIKGTDNKYKFINVDDDQEYYILGVEKKVMHDLLKEQGVTNPKDFNKKTLYNKNLLAKWKEICTQEINKEFNCDFYYNNYKLITTQFFINNILEVKDLDNIKNTINRNMILSNIKSGAIKSENITKNINYEQYKMGIVTKDTNHEMVKMNRADIYFAEDFVKIGDILINNNTNSNEEFNTELFIKSYEFTYKQCIKLYNNGELFCCNGLEAIKKVFPNDFNIDDFSKITIQQEIEALNPKQEEEKNNIFNTDKPLVVYTVAESEEINKDNIYEAFYGDAIREARMEELREKEQIENLVLMYGDRDFEELSEEEAERQMNTSLCKKKYGFRVNKKK